MVARKLRGTVNFIDYVGGEGKQRGFALDAAD
jgi:hypothetical protein